MTATAEDFPQVAFNGDGLVPVVVQQFDTLEVLMLAWMSPESLRRTLSERRAVYWSRSRNEYWRKGDTSGNTQVVHRVAYDCDGDTLLMLVDQHGAACHTGSRTCFDERDLAFTDTAHAQPGERAE